MRVEAALEHYRVVAQSELQVLDGDHFMVFRERPTLARIVAAFLARLDAHAARTRATAEPARVLAAVRPAQSRLLPPLRGLVLLVLLIALSVALSLVATTVLIVRKQLFKHSVHGIG